MTTYRFTANDLSRLLLAIDSKIDSETKKPVLMVIIGGAAILLAHNPFGATKDIDTLSDISPLRDAYEKAKKETGIDALLERVTVADYPYEYETRLEIQTIPGLKNIKIYIPEKHDLALMKAVRGDENDVDGIIRIHQASVLDPAILISRFCNEMGHVLGDPRRLQFNFLNIIERLFGAEVLKEAETALTPSRRSPLQ